MHTTGTAFDDMDNDMDFDAQPKTTVITDAIAAQRFASVKTHTTFTERCGKCGGTGRYSGPSSHGSRCFACDGAGFKAFKTSPEQRAQARAKAADRKERQRDERLAAFIEAYPEMHAWMTEKAASFDFAANMLDAVRQYGDLTDAQRAAVERCMARDAERKATAAQRVEDPLAKALEAVLEKLQPRDRDFAKSLLAGHARYGSFSERQLPHVQRLVASAAAPAADVVMVPKFFDVLQRHAKFYIGKITITRKNADSLCWIKHDDSADVVGKIEGGKVVLFGKRMQAAGLDDSDILPVLRDLENDPLGTAKAHGKLAGRCCSCGRELTDENSIAAGIGPICAEKFAG